MAKENEDGYTAEAVACHACAARDRKARNFASAENSVTDGVYYAIRRDDD